MRLPIYGLSPIEEEKSKSSASSKISIYPKKVAQSRKTNSKIVATNKNKEVKKDNGSYAKIAASKKTKTTQSKQASPKPIDETIMESYKKFQRKMAALDKKFAALTTSKK